MNTPIVLIPKFDNPMELKDYCPIGVCNILYKIVLKCLANRLRPILGDVISKNRVFLYQGG
jgi:hypothetical protein